MSLPLRTVLQYSAIGAALPRMRRRVGKTLLSVAALVAALFAVFPMYWLFVTSIKPSGEVSTSPPIFFPTTITWQNYLDVYVNDVNGRYLLNSAIVSVVSTFLMVFIGALAAYALAKTYLPPRLRHGLLLWILISRIYPPITTAIPYYVLISNAQLTDTYQALILAYVASGLPFVIWLMLGFFQDLPPEIEEAAIMDGCSVWQRFSRVALPLAMPALAVTAMFAFAYAWNEFLYASLLTSFNAKTLPVVIASYFSDKGLEWGKMSALGTAMVLPVILFIAVAQRHLVRGLTFGAVKG